MKTKYYGRYSISNGTYNSVPFEFGSKKKALEIMTHIAKESTPLGNKSSITIWDLRNTLVYVKNFSK